MYNEAIEGMVNHLLAEGSSGLLYLTETAEGADRQQTIVDQLKEVLDTCL